MKRRWMVGALLLLSCGCSTMNNTESGALGGGAIGAVAGTLVGAACRAPLVGAAVGAVAGAGIGAAAGASEDRHEAHVQQAVNAQTAAQQQAAQDAAARAPKLTDIVAMSRNGTSDAVIINQIRGAYPAVYQLNADDINYLKGNGVSDVVVMELQNTARAQPAGTTVIYERGPRYVYDPYYYPPPPVGGVVFVGGCRHW
jgi:hypothetical protein